ncbi:hypothetical protein DPSP01_008907 [Paraphaeosphaeria sporulosa]|uniref:Uncharacterized protein n=1 Tax=Paraphaeosphaeria sporulosa TaxID=1460663 RepID=A0A177CL70_9PLEO|nr:uncharacterized protein CC84DRAFT_1088887 [Paraphaeosphaeria sporulosa]OAG07692.1 hypothetical protein CC84DRAFT_1088887 [Paraphaeosphaeria sporulosa]
MSNNKIAKVPSRLPAPALFVGPPSHNASATSLLPGTGADKPSRVPLTRQRSLLSPDGKRPPPPLSSTSAYDGDPLKLSSSNPNAPFVRHQRQQNEAADAEASSRAEAIWAEMQNTLEEVELSAIKGPGMTVFGSEHSRALEDLRRAQIDLAKAWARSEAEELDQSSEDRKTAGVTNTDVADLLNIPERSMEKSNQGSPKAGSNSGGTFEKSKLEEETEKDIELSRKRREANDRYFEKVNRGVLEVVNKLEEVAKAMKTVESESKEIWSDNQSAETASTTAPSVT